MNQPVYVNLSYSQLHDHDSIQVEIIVNDQSLINEEVTFKITAHALVKDSRAVNNQRVMFSKKVRLTGSRSVFAISKSDVKAFSYNGGQIKIEIHASITINDGILFDSTFTEQEEIALGLKPLHSAGAKNIVAPDDDFNFFHNLQVIPWWRQMVTLCLCAIACCVITLNTLLGIHDQMVSEPEIYFYSHYSSDGDSSSPLANSLVLSGVFGGLIWAGILCQLRKYMKFKLKDNIPPISPGKEVQIASLFTGKSRIDLENITLRIVACNMEKGQYLRGSGSSRRTVSFREPVNGMVVFAKTIAHIPRGTPVENYFDEWITFDQMFHRLFPPIDIADTHGLDVHWEIQLIHDLLVDQELICSPESFKYSDFLNHSPVAAPKNISNSDRIFENVRPPES